MIKQEIQLDTKRKVSFRCKQRDLFDNQLQNHSINRIQDFFIVNLKSLFRLYFSSWSIADTFILKETRVKVLRRSSVNLSLCSKNNQVEWFLYPIRTTTPLRRQGVADSISA